MSEAVRGLHDITERTGATAVDPMRASVVLSLVLPAIASFLQIGLAAGAPPV